MFISQLVQHYNSDPLLYSRQFFIDNPTSARAGGRIIAIRAQRTFFMTLQWGRCTIQIMADSANACLPELTTLRVGDIVEIEGQLTRSMRGELSISPQSIHINSRTQHTVELRRDINTNPEELREVNLMRSSELLSNIYTRSHIVQSLRQYMYSQQFLEIETPILHDNPSGASARTFETHCFANNNRYHLRIAPEIYLVRTLMAGFEQIFEIGHNFRNEGISNRHQPEFTMLECYRSFADYEWAMGYVQTLLRYLGEQFNCPTLLQPYRTMTYQAALIEYHHSIGAHRAHLIEDRNWLMAQLPLANGNMSLEMLQFQLFETIDSLIMEPTFITHHPVEISPLAQSFNHSGPFTERFELFINGRELGNGFSQLIDLPEQQRRFDMQSLNHEEEAMRTDHTYMQSMSHAFPRIGGFGIGIDRLVMLLTGQQDIRNVVLFPV